MFFALLSLSARPLLFLDHRSPPDPTCVFRLAVVCLGGVVRFHPASLLSCSPSSYLLSPPFPPPLRVCVCDGETWTCTRFDLPPSSHTRTLPLSSPPSLSQLLSLSLSTLELGLYPLKVLRKKYASCSVHTSTLDTHNTLTQGALQSPVTLSLTLVEASRGSQISPPTFIPPSHDTLSNNIRLARISVRMTRCSLPLPFPPLPYLHDTLSQIRLGRILRENDLALAPLALPT